jgi:hypothetical protein
MTATACFARSVAKADLLLSPTSQPSIPAASPKKPLSYIVQSMF